MKVKTDYDGCPNITAGKVYEAYSNDEILADAVDDYGEDMLIYLGGTCVFLDDIGTWTVVEE